MHYAHTLPDKGPEDWEPLEQHLSEVAQQTAEFAGALMTESQRVADWGRVLGQWHDLGKYSEAFQNYLKRSTDHAEAHIEGVPGRVDHSTAGAKYAAERLPQFGRLLSFILAGHHAGLADNSNLNDRLAKVIEPWQETAKPEFLSAPQLDAPPVSVEHGDGKRLAFQLAFFARMLFSCLIDADRLMTEAFCNPEKSAERKPPLPLASLKPALDAYLAKLANSAKPTPVNEHRRDILAACRAAASQGPGLFSLTVPTGGGKTLASLAFALDHAQQHGQRRVVMAIPYTSIIDQTAKEYRKVFASLGDGVVLEHHSNLDPDTETRTNRLVAENWDAPLVVTTNVQLLESLFASRTSPCRKLHRLAGSVIILDEAQTLPVKLLKPCLAALRELATDYGCTIVLCTATQPALEYRDDFHIGLEGVREIIPQPQKLYEAMRRVEVCRLGKVSDDELVERLAAEPSWLTIVNTRPHAATLYQRLASETGDGDDLFHLSTYMCGAHRDEKLTAIRSRLKKKLPCRVVSTQLIEAGVDVDFPVVFRAMAGVDSIAQAAGRCNREGRLDGLGKLWLFDPSDVQPKDELGATADRTRELLPDYPDLLDPAAVCRYFELHYWSRKGDHAWDDKRVFECFPKEKGKFAYDFCEASLRFRLIQEKSQTVFVPYGKGAELLERFEEIGPDRWLLRKLQRYTVGVPEWYMQPLLNADVESVHGGYLVLRNSDLYDTKLGLLVDRPGHHKPESLMA